MTWILTSRRRVFFIALALLLVLDLGRSLYARVAYNTPSEEWQGEPYDLKLAVWPPASNVSANASIGEKVYAERCAICHGTGGDGKGVAAPSIYPRPRNFTLGQFKYKTTAPGLPPSDADLINIVSNGLHASPMPYFKDILTDEEITSVVQYVKDFSPVFAATAPEPISIPDRPTPDDASLARGQELFAANCASCHGADGRARAELKDADGFTVYTRDLTAPWTFRGGSEPEQIWLRLTTGLAPSPMPSFAETLTDEQRWDLANYVLSIARPAPWEPGGKLDGPRTDADLVKRGEYITHTEICGLCHTQVNPTGIYRGDDHYLAGGMQVGAYPQGTFVSRNLTSDAETGLGNKSVEEIANIIRNGQASDRSVNFWGMPWAFLHSMSEEDATAVASYLKTLPPVKNQIPSVMEYGVIETVIMKIASGLPVASPKVLTYAAGSYGNINAGPLPADWPRQALTWTQWLVLIGGTVIWVAAAPRERRFPRKVGGWLLAGIVVIGLALCGLITSVIYDIPATPALPPDIVAEQVLAGLPEPDPASFDSPEQLALAERGKYVFSSISCAFCHGNNGSGGAKLSGLGMGTIWTRNISQDGQTGIGSWSDAEIARAIRSGISRDGRQLHWQAMPWDHFANLDEEDVQALVVYLRLLPPVNKQIPAYRPPALGDCEAYTFFLSQNNFEPGCK